MTSGKLHSKVPGILAVLVYFLCSAAIADSLFCDETKTGTLYRTDLPTELAEQLINRSTPLFPSGKITCDIHLDISGDAYISKRNIKTQVETGSFQNIKYEIWYLDGSGSIQGKAENTLNTGEYSSNWHTSCEVDPMDDKHYCKLYKEPFYIYKWKDGKYRINVGLNHFPGSVVTVRIDKNKPITADEEKQFSTVQSAEIIRQMKSGKKLISRYQEWPYERNKDDSYDLFGISAALKVLDVLYKNTAP